MLNAVLLSLIEEAGAAVLTLTEGLQEAEFLRSRLTRRAVRQQVATLVDTLANLPAPTRALMPELDWEGWLATSRQLTLDGDSEGAALWFAARSLIPATLIWLRVYRQNQPELFAYKPAAPSTQ